jgi:hypothetical protein
MQSSQTKYELIQKIGRQSDEFMAFMVLITLKFEPSSLEESSAIYGPIFKHHSHLAPQFRA